MNQCFEDSTTIDQQQEPAKWFFQISILIEVCLKSSLLDILYDPKFGDFPKSCKAGKLNEILADIQGKMTRSSVQPSEISTKNADPNSLVETKPIIGRLDVIAISFLILEKSELKPKLLSVVKDSKDDSIIDEYLDITSSITSALDLKARILSTTLALRKDDCLNHKKTLVSILQSLSYRNFELFNSLFNDGENLASFAGLKRDLLEEKRVHLMKLKSNDEAYFFFTASASSKENRETINTQLREVEKILQIFEKETLVPTTAFKEDFVNNQHRVEGTLKTTKNEEEKQQEQSEQIEVVPIRYKTDMNENRKPPIQEQSSQTKDALQIDKTNQSPNENCKLPIQEQHSQSRDTLQTNQSSIQNVKFPIQEQSSPCDRTL